MPTAPPVARQLSLAIEPVVGQVYFAPECHDRYAALGFAGSPATIDDVALPDGPAYFTSRGSILGQVPGEVVAATFGVFNPAVVVPAVRQGWTLTDAATINEARTAGAVEALVRMIGPHPDGLDRVNELLARATAPLAPAGRSLFAGLVALGVPDDPLAAMWRRGDLLREYRGDAHLAAWTAAGLDAVEIILLTDLHLGLPLGSYSRTRGWSDEQMAAGTARLQARGLLDGEGFSAAGLALREEIEAATDVQVAPALDALGDDVHELIERVQPWSDAVRAAGGYPRAGGRTLGGGRSARG